MRKLRSLDLTHRIETNRSSDEIKETLSNVEKVYNDLVQKHERYTEFIEDDAAFETEEKWLEDCQKQFLSLEARAKGYLDEMIKANSPKLQVNGENNTDVTQSEETEENSNEKEVVILEASQEDSSQVETPQASQNTIAQDDISEVRVSN